MTGATALGVCVCGALLPCPCQHLIVHPFPVQGCGRCRQPTCRICHAPDFECRDWQGHAEEWMAQTRDRLLAVTARAGVS